ncbi:MAG: aminodeoxychorismate/anthranilate synthase component II [Muribaculaceae bacterium]|nr:aminodeoxychorismate/anthranilate synthase component II [Muribaculaceae bacterium]
MKILVFDNYDSFTYNIVHALRELGVNPDVIRNDRINLDEVEQYDKIVISPGPGIPEEAGLLMPLLQRYAETKPILGVCLGHQAIGERFGAKLYNLPEVYHGISTPIKVVKEDYIFNDLPRDIQVGRYHSWVVDNEGFPNDCLEVTATDDKGMIMAMRHKLFDIHGVQFHPESVLTPQGIKIIENWLNH